MGRQLYGEGDQCQRRNSPNLLVLCIDCTQSISGSTPTCGVLLSIPAVSLVIGTSNDRMRLAVSARISPRQTGICKETATFVDERIV